MGTSRVQSKMRFLIYPALALGLVAALGAPRAHAQTRIRLGTLAPRGSSLHQALQEMGQKWRQAPDGGVQLTIYPDGNMGTEPELVQRMRVGQLQAAMLTVTGLAQIEPDVTALQYMPMMFRSLDEVEYVRLKLEPKLEKRLLDKGFVVLFWGDAGWVRFFSRRPGLVPDDFKTMKVYVGASDNKQSDIMKAIPELLDLAEQRAGGDCDNLSVVAMTWAETHPGAIAGEVSTRTLKRDGVTIVMVSHDMSNIERFSDRVALLEQGRLVTTGEPRAVVNEYLTKLAERSPAARHALERAIAAWQRAGASALPPDEVTASRREGHA